LSRIGGNAFETFSNEMISSVFGTTFVPLGGNKDGGADGFLDAGCFEGEKENRFMQASIEEVPANKIRKTCFVFERSVGIRNL